MSRVQLEIFLGTILILISGTILLIVGFREEERMNEFEDFQLAHEIEVGADLFEINCRGCHGLRGEGIPGLAPPLNSQHFFNDRLSEVGWEGALKDYIVATISTGRQVSTRPDLYPGAGKPAMPTWSEKYGGPLREDQVVSIAVFVMNWESTATGEYDIVLVPTPGPTLEELEDPVARGKILYDNNGCGACHTIEGFSSGAVGPALTNIATISETRIDGVSAQEYIRNSILNPSSYIVEGYDDLMVKSFGEALSDQEIEDILAFLMEQK